MIQIIKELIEVVAPDFKAHLELKNNERIIFSGKFGKGKTTFLQEFFQDQNKYNEKNEYYPLFLDPVNYSVSTNEDIFQYIKYDIILSLIENDASFEDTQFNKLETTSNYIFNNTLKIIKPFVSYIPKVGKLVDVLLPKLENLCKEIDKFHSDANKQAETARIVSFLDSLKMDTGSIYENDIITTIIQRILKMEGKAGKKSVLVIDNLDRIDPEHIFRILNVFSTHMDINKNLSINNKFGFEKIILVCDIHNIQNIFKNKFGIDVDFNGYIDKFYSVEPFYFQNYEQIYKVCESAISNIKVKFLLDKADREFSSFSHNDSIYNILIALIDNDLISLRQVLNFSGFSVKKAIISYQNIPINVSSKSPILEMMLISKIMGGYEYLITAIKKLNDKNIKIKDMDRIFKNFLYFDSREEHKLNNYDGEFNIIFKGRILYIYLENDHGTMKNIEVKEIKEGSTENKIKVPFIPSINDFYYLYIKILEDLYNEKIL